MQLHYRFLICGAMSISPEIEELRKLGHECIILEISNRQQAISDFRTLVGHNTVDGLLFLAATHPIGKLDTEIFEIFLPTLKYVGGIGAGYDHVDIEYLTSKKVLYANTPVAVSEPTAITATMLILQTLRGSSQAEMSVRAGRWSQGLELPPDVRDITVGLLGLGKIGKLVQRNVESLGMKVIYHNRHKLPSSEEGNAVYTSFEQLLKSADLISVHVPLSDETRHLLSDTEFNKMKDGVFVVNTARGAIIDEMALVQALRSNKVKRVGLDVFENEPNVNPWLLTSSRATLLPHRGSMTTRIVRDVELEAVENLRSWILTGHPNTPVNPVHK